MNDTVAIKKNQTSLVYNHGFDHIADEIRRLDILIHIRIQEFHKQLREQEHYVAADPSFIASEEIIWLLNKDRFLSEYGDTNSVDGTTSELFSLLSQQENTIEKRLAHSLKAGVNLPLVNLARWFNLSQFEILVLLACIGPELNRRYDRIYAYLQDDITRKKPSLDLILDLFCVSDFDRWEKRSFLEEQSNLFRYRLIERITDEQSPSSNSGLARFIHLNSRILLHLLASNPVNRRIEKITEIIVPGQNDISEYSSQITADFLLEIANTFLSSNSGISKKSLVMHISGASGVGKKTLVETVCKSLNTPVLILNIAETLTNYEDFDSIVLEVFRESILLQMPLYLRHFDHLLKDDVSVKSKLVSIIRQIKEFGGIYFVSGILGLNLKFNDKAIQYHHFSVALPEVQERLRIWRRMLLEIPLQETVHSLHSDVVTKENKLSKKSYAIKFSVDNEQLELLADRFQLTPGQISIAIRIASSKIISKVEQADYFTHLLDSCRLVSNQNLSQLSSKIVAKYGWDDIVLPEYTTDVLKAMCNQVKYQNQVFGEWGFAQKFSYGKGLSVLFSGVPGTGKTMASQVIARELRLDLYKIDLSTVVSKYIGETEKNLNKVFNEAATSNAVLFFDEADSLFGKRTEISDSHDRYANLEVSYLLQKMEEYDGIVILATNLRNNMDDAFVRRIRFIIDFPFPDRDSRRIIWKKAIPTQAPLCDKIDYEMLAKAMTLSGGSIKNIALNAAFQAAHEESKITMHHLLASAKIEYSKIGKLWDDKAMLNLQGVNTL